jgi:hypothetical protein
MLSNSEFYVTQVHQHLCSKGLFGSVAQWCEMRNDCVWVVKCPDCGESFALEEDEYELLLARSEETAQSCGIIPIADELPKRA